MGKLIFLLTLIMSLQATAQMVEERVAKILGLASYHDGPNCYNAVSYALGFTDSLYQTSTGELQFYLANFCAPVSRADRKGDVLLITRGGVHEHAALYWDRERIFEKGGLAGLQGRYADRESAYYQTLPTKESRYLQQCRHGCQVKSYRCENREALKEKTLSRCQQGEHYKGIQLLQAMLMYTAFTPELGARKELPVLYEMVRRESARLDTLSEEDPCALYYLVQWQSLAWHLGNLQTEARASEGLQSWPFNERGYRRLHERLSQKLQDPRSQEILRQAAEL